MWLLTLLWRDAGEFLRLLSEGKLPGLLSSSFLKSDANGGVDDRFASIACERMKQVGTNINKTMTQRMHFNFYTRHLIFSVRLSKQMPVLYRAWNHAISIFRSTIYLRKMTFPEHGLTIMALRILGARGYPQRNCYLVNGDCISFPDCSTFITKQVRFSSLCIQKRLPRRWEQCTFPKLMQLVIDPTTKLLLIKKRNLLFLVSWYCSQRLL